MRWALDRLHMHHSEVTAINVALIAQTIALLRRCQTHDRFSHKQRKRMATPRTPHEYHDARLYIPRHMLILLTTRNTMVLRRILIKNITRAARPASTPPMSLVFIVDSCVGGLYTLESCGEFLPYRAGSVATTSKEKSAGYTPREFRAPPAPIDRSIQLHLLACQKPLSHFVSSDH